jgi:hypothetical protein
MEKINLGRMPGEDRRSPAGQAVKIIDEVLGVAVGKDRLNNLRRRFRKADSSLAHAEIS